MSCQPGIQNAPANQGDAPSNRHSNILIHRHTERSSIKLQIYKLRLQNKIKRKRMSRRMKCLDTTLRLHRSEMFISIYNIPKLYLRWRQQIAQSRVTPQQDCWSLFSKSQNTPTGCADMKLKLGPHPMLKARSDNCSASRLDKDTQQEGRGMTILRNMRLAPQKALPNCVRSWLWQRKGTSQYQWSHFRSSSRCY